MKPSVNNGPPYVTWSLRVVFVDENDDFREIASILLRSRGHTVWEASDGIVGAELIEKHHPNVAFIDLDLPRLSGFDMARRIRSQRSLEGVLLVCVTSSSLAADADRAIASGFDFYRVKPVGIEELEDAMRGGTSTEHRDPPRMPVRRRSGILFD